MSESHWTWFAQSPSSDGDGQIERNVNSDPYGGVHNFSPVKDTACGLPPPLSLTETSPLPVECDHVTLMLQELPAGKLALQLLLSEKGPEIVMPLMSKAVRPTLVSVVVSGGEQRQ